MSFKSIFESKKSHFEYIISIMKTNDIQIKDLTEYLLYQNNNKNILENPFKKMEVQDIKFGEIDLKEEEIEEEMEEVMEEIEKEKGPFNKITKITTEDTIKKSKTIFGNFKGKSWADDDSDNEDIINIKVKPSSRENYDEDKNVSYLEKLNSNIVEDQEFTKVGKKVKQNTKKYTKPKFTKTNKYKSKLTEDIINNRCNINSVTEYIDCLKNNMKPCKFGYKCTKKNCNFAHINTDAECDYTYTGVLCPDVRSCNKIHQKRCIYDMDCNNNYCSFKHSSDMPTAETQQAYIDSMANYENIVMKNYNKRDEVNGYEEEVA